MPELNKQQQNALTRLLWAIETIEETVPIERKRSSQKRRKLLSDAHAKFNIHCSVFGIEAPRLSYLYNEENYLKNALKVKAQLQAQGLIEDLIEVSGTPFKLEIVADVLCSALDSGYGYSYYWCTLKKRIQPSEWLFQSEPLPTDDGHYRQDYPLNPGGALVLIDDESEKELVLDREAIVRGLGVMAEKYPRHFADIIKEEGDAETGDVLLQCCLLGEIVYG